MKKHPERWLKTGKEDSIFKNTYKNQQARKKFKQLQCMEFVITQGDSGNRVVTILQSATGEQS